MILTNDLRLGNWVQNQKGDPIQLQSGADIDKASLFDSVPMSDAVLISCGFQYENYFKVWQKMSDFPGGSYVMEIDSDYNVRDFGHRYIGVHLTSLHQLQNLFFCLHQTEMDTCDFALQEITTT